MDSVSKKGKPRPFEDQYEPAARSEVLDAALGVSQEDLQRAVDKVGNSAATVRKELGLLADD